MWSRIAEEMAIPWRAAEAMHWQMGEQEMARRAGVTPFSLTTNLNQQQDPQPPPSSLPPHSRPIAHVRSNSAASRLRRDNHVGPGPYGVPLSTSSMMIPPQLPPLSELTSSLPVYSAGGSHGQPSPPLLTPPHHMYNHPGSGGYPFHQSRYSNGHSPHHSLSTPTTQVQASRP